VAVPFGWTLPDFWPSVAILGGWALVLSIIVPMPEGVDPGPAGRTWAAASLSARTYRWLRGDPRKLSTFRRAYRPADPERLSPDARVDLLDLVRHATDVSLDAAGLTTWALPPRWPPGPRIRSVSDAAALVPHVRRTAAAARLLLTS
jgi:hypothetical protein